MVQEFQGDYEVAALDLRGYGKSAKPKVPCSDTAAASLLTHMGMPVASLVSAGHADTPLACRVSTSECLLGHLDAHHFRNP